MTLQIYTNEQMVTLACNYAQAVYKNSESSVRDIRILEVCDICSRNTNDPIYTDPVDTELFGWVTGGGGDTPANPVPWDLGDVLAILPDAFWAWDGCEPRSDILSGVLEGFSDLSQNLCPVYPQSPYAGDAATLVQNIGYYHHVIWARTYYFDLCKMARLYLEYQLYLDDSGPLTDLGEFIDSYAMTDGSVVTNGVLPATLLTEWQNTVSPGGGKLTFSQWLLNDPNPTAPKPITGESLNTALICLRGVAGCNNFTETDSWWKLDEYGTSAPISTNLGLDSDYIGNGETRHINSISITNAPVLRVSWEDLWLPFAAIPGDIADFSTFVGNKSNGDIGPIVQPAQNEVCVVGSCCSEGDCTENVLQEACIGVSGLWSPGASCFVCDIVPYTLDVVTDFSVGSTGLMQDMSNIDVLGIYGYSTVTLATLQPCGANYSPAASGGGSISDNANDGIIGSICNSNIDVVTNIAVDTNDLRVTKKTIKVLGIKEPITYTTVSTLVVCSGTGGGIPDTITPATITESVCATGIYGASTVTDLVVVTDVYIEDSIIKQRKATITVIDTTVGSELYVVGLDDCTP